MKYVHTQPLRMNLKVLLNRLGYHQRQGTHTEFEFVRRLGRLSYPRFHCYITLRNNETHFKLHLDEKKPSYAGQTAHSGQYDSEMVRQELERIVAAF